MGFQSFGVLHTPRLDCSLVIGHHEWNSIIRCTVLFAWGEVPCVIFPQYVKAACLTTRENYGRRLY